ncbi:hypothetical protein M501DRAFT_1006285 [Patellaria atrata CBS 101060]|uniref:Uncharacterized protein n=1 Tax=Patellaria atrata CBS 101060 TaxID=1346257 RepID=A0A9P4S876_9PEZI|nr:hypothetical protein M501DRAFT_1006285 [Patellaria atrata CBS 101060]
MASTSTNDLRSGSVDHRRFNEHKKKWAHGASFGPGRRVGDGHARPARLLRDSSADEEIDEASAAPAPDADITYSYDALRGAGHGSQILSIALAQAVERFESRETDKLVKEEYEVLDEDGEPVVTKKKGKNHADTATVAEEEDYEFV